MITFRHISESIIENTYMNKRSIDPLLKSRDFVKDRKNGHDNFSPAIKRNQFSIISD